ncbi:hypothetical protein MNY64_14390 [Moellerella wisconsensis]|uniref:hypothetical protein n=1 Tax=Moellerella wisconsensis TaxID=158849 RepID=UPI001F4EA6BA|nr:hypothetical protein [Moellerella wisconsensis]UNH27006.1 hypothetical protein MNY64_14390 [Moellerella wisconsensis]
MTHIINATVRALNKIWKSGVRYNEADIILSDFSGSLVTQLNLFFENKPYKTSDQLMKTLDQRNNSVIGKVLFAGKGDGYRLAYET